MNRFKLLLAASLLCVSQFSMAVGTPADTAAYNNALATISSTATQAEVDALINLAANAGIAAADVVGALTAKSVPSTMIVSAMNGNINAGTPSGGTQNACAPSCSATTTGQVSYPSSVFASLTQFTGFATGSGTNTQGTTQILSSTITPPSQTNCPNGASRC